MCLIEGKFLCLVNNFMSLQAFPTFWETPRRFLYSKSIMIFEMVLSDPFSHEHPERTVTTKCFQHIPFVNTVYFTWKIILVNSFQVFSRGLISNNTLQYTTFRNSTNSVSYINDCVVWGSPTVCTMSSITQRFRNVPQISVAKGIN